MRISCIRGEEGYTPLAGQCVVLKDSKKQTEVVAADTDESWVEFEDSEGSRFRVHGEVEILLSIPAGVALKTPAFIRTADWLHACGKQIGDKDLSVQVGVHIEEMAEFLEQLSGDFSATVSQLEIISRDFKQGLKAEFRNPAAALDALCDMEVTGNGVAYLAGWNKLMADQLVLEANDRKLVNGKPVILAGGKIGKPENWTPADLRDCV